MKLTSDRNCKKLRTNHGMGCDTLYSIFGILAGISELRHLFFNFYLQPFFWFQRWKKNIYIYMFWDGETLSNGWLFALTFYRADRAKIASIKQFHRILGKCLYFFRLRYIILQNRTHQYFWGFELRSCSRTCLAKLLALLKLNKKIWAESQIIFNFIL